MLRDGDWISLYYGSLVIQCSSIASSFLQIVPPSSLLSTLFQIRGGHSMHYGGKFHLMHWLTSKYLSMRHGQVRLTDSSVSDLLLEGVVGWQSEVQEGQPCRVVDSKGNVLSISEEEGGRRVCARRQGGSVFVLRRVNMGGSELSNVGVYQIHNIESNLQLNTMNMCQFKRSVNEYDSYVSLHLRNALVLREQRVDYGEEIMIQWYCNKRYVKYDRVRKACMVSVPDEGCVFVLEKYKSRVLGEDVAVKIRHKESGLYLSREARLEPFVLESACMVSRVEFQRLRTILFINEMYSVLRSVTGKTLHEQQDSSQLDQVLSQIIKFIFGTHDHANTFLQMNDFLPISITATEQNLLKETGFLTTLLYLSTTETNVCDLMMVIAGMCISNQPNTVIFCTYISHYTTLLHKSGVIQCIYQIFASQQSHIHYLQSLQCSPLQCSPLQCSPLQCSPLQCSPLQCSPLQCSPLQCSSLSLPPHKYLWHLLKTMSVNGLDNRRRVKMIRLLQCLIVVNRRSVMSVHQHIAIQCMHLIEQLFMRVDISATCQIMVNGCELYEMMDHGGKYEGELRVFVAQFHFLCSVCRGRRLDMFRKYMPETTLLNYIKGQLAHEYRLLLLRVLDQIYLAGKIVMFSNDIVVVQGVSGDMRVQGGDHHTMDKIKHILLERTMKAVKNEVIDASLYMSVRVLGTMVKLDMLSHHEFREFRDVLHIYITNNCQKNLNESSQLIVEILKIFSLYQSLQIIKHRDTLLRVLRGLKDQRSNDRVIESTKRFLVSDAFFNRQRCQMGSLARLIQQSILNDSKEIFFQASMLQKDILQRDVRVIRSLKDAITVETREGEAIYHKALLLKKQLITHISDYSPSTPQHNAFKHTLKSLIALFHQATASGERRVSPFVQNIFREFYFMELIVQFMEDCTDVLLRESQLFPLLIEYLLCFIQQNHSNVLRLQKVFPECIFGRTEQTQSRLLHSLIRHPVARTLMGPTLFTCIMTTLKLAEVKPYAVMGLLHLLYDSSLTTVHQTTVDEVALLLLNPTTYQPCPYTNTLQANIEMCFVGKVCMVLQEHAATKINAFIRRVFPLECILRMLLEKDILNEYTMRELGMTMLKVQLIGLLERVYEEQLLVSNFVREMSERATYIRKEQEGMEGLIQELEQESDVSRLCHYSFVLLLKDEHYSRQSVAYRGHFDRTKLIVCVYYPLMLKMVDRAQREQLSYLLPHLKNNLKECVSRLSGKEYKMYQKEYNEGIGLCEDILRTKLGINLVSVAEKDDSATGEYLALSYKNTTIHNVFDNCAYGGSTFVLEIMYSQEMWEFLNGRRIKLKVNEDNYRLAEMLNSIEQENKIAIVELFLFFTQDHFSSFLKDVGFSLYSSLISKVARYCESDSSNLTTRAYLMTSNILLSVLMKDNSPNQTPNLNPSILIGKDDTHTITHNHHLQSLFTQRIVKFIKKEMSLYAECHIPQQCTAYCESFLLSYQRESDCLTIEIVLRWIRNKMIFFVPQPQPQPQPSSQPQQQFLPSKSLTLSTKQMGIFLESSIDLFKQYVFFLSLFHYRYIPRELSLKLILCLQIIFQALTNGTRAYLNIILNKEVWSEMNTILSLNDSWATNLQESTATPLQLLEKAMKAQSSEYHRKVLSQVLSINEKSARLYGSKIIYESGKFPLQPIKRLYGDMKGAVIAVLKEMRVCGHRETVQRRFERNICEKTIDINLQWIYEKHLHLFNRYGITSIYTDVVYGGTYFEQIARNLCVENGVDLMSIKMGSNSGMRKNYRKHRLEEYSKRKPNLLQSIFAFFEDIGRVFTSISRRKRRVRATENEEKNKNEEDVEKVMREDTREMALESQQEMKRENIQVEKAIREELKKEVEQFFYSKLGRVQVIANGRLCVSQYMIRPECVSREAEEHIFLKNISFVSVQLKLQSIIAATSYFGTFYKFHKFGMLTFLARHVNLLVSLFPLLIVSANIILLLNPNDKETYFRQFNFNEPFEVIVTFNFCIAAFSYLIFCLKELPLIVVTERQKHKTTSNFIFSVIIHRAIFYRSLHIIILGLVFYNKLFVALLTLDLLLRLPAIKKLLRTVWRTNFQILLTLILFIIIQYFFTIIIYYYFSYELKQYCVHFSDCFGLIYITSFNSSSGFVGFVTDNFPSLKFSVAMQIFIDIYIVFIYLIFGKMILVIVLDSYSQLRREKFERKENHNVACLICGLNRSVFNQAQGINFKEHLTIDHNIWSYFYYYYCLQQKALFRRSSFEKALVGKLDTEWLPNGRTMSIR